MIIEKEVIGRTFTREEILEKALDTIAENQRSIDDGSNERELAVVVAYNDGVIDFTNELLREIEG